MKKTKPEVKKKVKDFDFNNFPSVKKSKAKKLHDALEKHYTALPYEIEGEPILNCTKWQAMCLVLGFALLLTYKIYHG